MYDLPSTPVLIISRKSGNSKGQQQVRNSDKLYVVSRMFNWQLQQRSSRCHYIIIIDSRGYTDSIS